MTSNTPAVVVSKGDSVSLHCQAAGIPRPVIRMFKGTDEVSLTSNQTATTSVGMIISSSEFHLMHVETEDAGLYMCIATNKAGSDNATMSLDVQCKTFDRSIAGSGSRRLTCELYLCSFSCLCDRSIQSNDHRPVYSSMALCSNSKSIGNYNVEQRRRETGRCSQYHDIS